jgi:hypothetical protein
MESIYSSKILVDFQQTTWCYIPDDRILHRHRCENLKAYINVCSSSNTLFPIFNKHTIWIHHTTKCLLDIDLQWSYMSLKQTRHSHNVLQCIDRQKGRRWTVRSSHLWVTFIVTTLYTLTQPEKLYTTCRTLPKVLCSLLLLWFLYKNRWLHTKHLKNYRHSLYFCCAAVVSTVKHGQWATVAHHNTHKCNRCVLRSSANWLGSQDHSWPIKNFPYWFPLNWVNVHSVWNMKTRFHGLK